MRSMGVMLIGTLLSAVLFGASMVQTVYYFVQYPNDKVLWKWLVSISSNIWTALN